MIDSKELRNGQEEREGRREFMRIDDLLRVDYRKISQQEFDRSSGKPEAIFRKVFGDPVIPPEIEEVDLKLLYNLIYQANLKMDRILEALETRDGSPYSSVDTEYVNISGSGMKFVSEQGYAIGDMIALKIFLPMVSNTWLTVLGRVVSSTELPRKEGYSTAVRFEGLSEDDREMIIRYIFKRQRELLRLTSDMKAR